MSTKKHARLRELIAEATVDCYGEDEEHTGMLTMIEENLQCPFHARVIGEKVAVVDLEWPKSGYGLMAVCQYKNRKYRVDINSVEFIKPFPAGYEWVMAYLLWRSGMNDQTDEHAED